MYAKCIKCGSESTHRSRIRSGERAGGMFFLKPVRCRDCKERFWVRNPSAYFTAAASLAFFALVITTIWLVVEENMGSSVTLEASKSGPDQPPANSATGANNGRLVAGAG